MNRLRQTHARGGHCARSGRGARRRHDDFTGVLKSPGKVGELFVLPAAYTSIHSTFQRLHWQSQEQSRMGCAQDGDGGDDTAMLDVGAFILKHLPTLVQLGAPVRVMQANTLYDKFSRKALPAELQARVVALTHDAAEAGVGCLHCEEPDVPLYYGGRRQI
jgi:hypothetical protein